MQLNQLRRDLWTRCAPEGYDPDTPDKEDHVVVISYIVVRVPGVIGRKTNWEVVAAQVGTVSPRGEEGVGEDGEWNFVFLFLLGVRE